MTQIIYRAYCHITYHLVLSVLYLGGGVRLQAAGTGLLNIRILSKRCLLSFLSFE